LLYEFWGFEVGVVCNGITHQSIDQLQRICAEGMVGGGDLFDEGGQELWLGVNCWFEALEASDSRLRGSVEGVSNNGCQY
jgi:hypothetical protein